MEAGVLCYSERDAGAFSNGSEDISLTNMVIWTWVAELRGGCYSKWVESLIGHDVTGRGRVERQF